MVRGRSLGCGSLGLNESSSSLLLWQQQWHVKLFGWDAEAQIKQDLTLYESVTGRDHVLLEVIFPKVQPRSFLATRTSYRTMLITSSFSSFVQEYPNLPPFIRVVYPRFHQYTGHITIGTS